jgi:IrrE N-terminal-like domain
VPLLRCTDDECGYEFFVRSQLAVGAVCEECGADTVLVGVDDDVPEELNESVVRERAHPAHARTKARQVAREHGFVRPPVVVHSIARQLGFTVKPSNRLGSLRARLVGNLIEVNAAEPPVAQRFSVAHELGHHFLGSQHGDGESAEREADAFAGELLMPGPMLRDAMRTTTDAVELRGLFKVSRDVLEIAARTHALADRLTGT